LAKKRKEPEWVDRGDHYEVDLGPDPETKPDAVFQQHSRMLVPKKILEEVRMKLRLKEMEKDKWNRMIEKPRQQENDK
jgi:hypothetical protein